MATLFKMIREKKPKKMFFFSLKYEIKNIKHFCFLKDKPSSVLIFKVITSETKIPESEIKKFNKFKDFSLIIFGCKSE